MAYHNYQASLAIANTFRSLAEAFSKEDSPEQAFKHYIIALKLNPGLKNELKIAFASALCDLGKVLEHENKFDDLFSSYEIALTIFPQNELILNNLGAHLCRLQQPKAALNYFKKALELNHDYLPAYRNIEISKSLLVERWHFRMLNDSMRNEGYRKAIFKKISEGHETILDIGTGTGILSVYAKQGGAKKVYGCDYSETMISIANNVIRVNSMEDSITLINKLSNDLSIPEDIPERLSLAVTETFDGGLLGEHILETLIHAWENLLLPGTDGNGQVLERVLPKGAILYAVPIECLQIARKNFLVKSDRTERRSFQLGLDLSGYNFYCESEEPYDTENLKEMSYSCLAQPLRLFTFNFNNLSELKRYYSGEISQTFEIVLTKHGYVDSFAIWFEMILDDETTITSSPLKECRCCWEQAIFPQREQWIVDEGCIISLQSSCKNGIISLKPEKLLTSVDEKVSIPQSTISFLNCESLLLSHLELINTLNNVSDLTSILDISYFPYSAALLAWRFGSKVFASHPNADVINATRKIMNSIDISTKMTYVTWPEIIIWTENNSKQFNIISVDVLDTTGQINEEVIVMLPALRNLLPQGGLIIPSRLNIWCKLVFSEQLLMSSQVNGLEDKLKIAEFINEYKVSHLIDINIHETKYEEMSESFVLGVIDLMNANNEKIQLEKEKNVSKSGHINSLLYWFSYQFTDNIEHSTSSEDSNINQCAVILDSPLQVTTMSKIKIILDYHSGVTRFDISTV